MSKDYYRIRLSVGEDSGEGTIWPVDDRHIEFLGDWDYLEGRHAPTVVNLGDRSFNEAGIRQAFKEHFDPTFHLAEMAKPALGHAQYHPRIYRQGSGPEAVSVYGHEFTSDIVAFSILERSLERLFSVLEPDSANNTSHGHEIRQLLILACTEVENLLKRVLVTNRYPPPKKDRWSTNDFVKLLPVLRLDFFESELMRYPDYQPIMPFHGWDAAEPTGSLDWYDAYNKTKHDRWTGLKLATFKQTITAVAAVHVLLTAQFGFGLLKRRVGRFVTDTESGSSRVFKNHCVPQTPLREQYIPWIDGGLGWVAVPYSF